MTDTTHTRKVGCKATFEVGEGLSLHIELDEILDRLTPEERVRLAESLSVNMEMLSALAGLLTDRHTPQDGFWIISEHLDLIRAKLLASLDPMRRSVIQSLLFRAKHAEQLADHYRSMAWEIRDAWLDGRKMPTEKPMPKCDFPSDAEVATEIAKGTPP